MSTTDQRGLSRALRDGPIERVYYFHGDEDLLKEEALRQLIDRVVDPATRDFNHDTLRGPDLDGELLARILNTPPMMAQRRLVVIRDVGGLKTDARAALERYVKRPAPDLVLVLVGVAGAKVDRTLEGSAMAVAFAALTGERVARWIVHHATSTLGAHIAPGAATLLQDAVGTDLPQLAAELDKLASFCRGEPITEDAVAQVVGVRRGETLGDLLDRIAERDVTGALGLLGHVLSQPKTSAVQIVMALTTQTLAIAGGRAMVDRRPGLPPHVLGRELMNLLRETGAYTMRGWNEAVACWSRAVPAWSAADTERALDALLTADMTLKESRISSEEQVLATLVLQMCMSSRRAAA
jgi:DNA polymerase-3 subunit delta